MTITIDKGIYDNHYKTAEESKMNIRISKQEKDRLEEKFKNIQKEYPDLFKI
jgi:hypothetical protein